MKKILGTIFTVLFAVIVIAFSIVVSICIAKLVIAFLSILAAILGWKISTGLKNIITYIMAGIMVFSFWWDLREKKDDKEES